MKSILNSFILIILISCNQISEQLKIDYCLDKGGSWNYETNKCEYDSISTKTKLNSIATKFEGLTTRKSNKILKTYKAAKQANKKEKYQIDLIFMRIFPTSFEEMNQIFGFDNEKGAGPIYYGGRDIIKYFSQLELKERQEYYEKYINICINGRWYADNITNAFGIHKRILNDTEEICRELNKKSNEELKTVFRFIFDGPHPKNEVNEYMKNELLKTIPDKYQRIKKLLKYSYEKLINENHNH